MDWKEQAKQLHNGESRKIPCCGTDPTAYISNSMKGIRFGPCFRCGVTDWEAHDKEMSIKDLIRLREAVVPTSGRAYYPETVPLNVAPLQAQQWVLSAGITPEEVSTRYFLGWSERAQRVIMPILKDGLSTGAYTARSVYNRVTPKYLSSRDAAGKHWSAGEGKSIILVEDILSAIKINSGSNQRVVAILGTSLNTELVMSLDKYDTVIGWFDNDFAGYKAFKELRKKMRLVDSRLLEIKTKKDPKYYSTNEIKEIIHNAFV